MPPLLGPPTRRNRPNGNESAAASAKQGGVPHSRAGRRTRERAQGPENEETAATNGYRTEQN